ncbi:MAG: prepilin-type N-terminal cleavage/methylation domain-containing protein [bacterium]|jgi:prepilin-type N-terminal cleavage/methylation domain-containing protein|nr:prepilin-type N-terminal cleavage/methylation domain-containing protein [bacterium]
MKKNGFTLIELLIVVAIIGILAAIAVPNFLNAQLRANIARCQADLRALASGAEQYYLDLNQYPPSHMIWMFTTPTPYLSTIPTDVFHSQLVKNSQQPEAFAQWTWYRYMSLPKGDSGHGTALCGDYWAYFAPFAPRAEAMSISSQRACPARWYTKSFGPNAGMQGLCGTNGDDCTMRYDASNGLRSIGDIAIFGPGSRIE